jgi:hypothetical protein
VAQQARQHAAYGGHIEQCAHLGATYTQNDIEVGPLAGCC